MKEKRDCKIVQDLLPNYIEELTNEETNNYIEEHLMECDECQEILENMQKNLNINDYKREKKEVEYIKKYNKKLRMLELIIIIILLLTLSAMTYYYFYFKNGYTDAANQLVYMGLEGMYPDTFYATIEEISDSEVYGIKEIKVKGLDINDINYRGEYYISIPLNNIGDNFKIKWHESNINFEQLKVGQTVAIYDYDDVKSETTDLSKVRMIVVLDDTI